MANKGQEDVRSRVAGAIGGAPSDPSGVKPRSIPRAGLLRGIPVFNASAQLPGELFERDVHFQRALRDRGRRLENRRAVKLQMIQTHESRKTASRAVMLATAVQPCPPHCRALPWAGLAFAVDPGHALASVGAPHVDDGTLGLAWALPFVGILSSIALIPLLGPKFWHRHFGKISAFWAGAFLMPFAVSVGLRLALYETLHTLLPEYVPFILLLFALFVVAGGIRVVGNPPGTPGRNTAILAFGTIIASLLGTTGAAMLLVRPLIRANERRRRKVHVFVFFIFLVANIGGSLTPLGDPPLFLGFLQGVDFTWTLRAMFAPMLLCSAILLSLFYLIDYVAWRREMGSVPKRASPQMRLEGSHNLLLLAGVVGVVLVSGLWQPGIYLTVFYVPVPLQGIVRDLLLLLLTWLSWRTTPKPVRIENAFT